MGQDLRLQQNSSTFAGASNGERIWAFTRRTDGRYSLAAQLRVERVTESPAPHRYGQFEVIPIPLTTVFYDVETGPDIEPLIRSLDLSMGDGPLGQSFQGPAAVRRLRDEEDQRLETFATEVAVLAPNPVRQTSEPERASAPASFRALVKYEDYTRKDVHDILAPAAPFDPRGGPWAIHGIIPLQPERPHDFAFFVTYGQKQAGHVFDEGITTEGVLTWQSQPGQGYDDTEIRQLIAHEEERHSVYLFLRTKKGRPYTYLGSLKYLSHDGERERPVHFKWQILDWGITPEALEHMGLRLLTAATEGGEDDAVSSGKLVETAPPPPTDRERGRSETTRSFRARKGDQSQRDAANRALGLAGELIVVEAERDRLRVAGRPDLAEQVVHTALIEGDGAGYDVRSFELDGSVRFIEVKTTTGGSEVDFFITPTERAFSEEHAAQYWLYRVFEYHKASESGRYYVIRGDLSSAFTFVATLFRARR
jgi:hypothetical protein